MRQCHWLLFVLGLAAFTSCQKSYNPPDLVIPGGTGSGGSGASGTQLVKYEAKGVNTSEGTTITYQYDASGRITRYDETYVDSSNIPTSYYFKYFRNASGNVTKVSTNAYSASAPGQGYPDTVVYNVHYPAGSSNFDYTWYNMDLGGVVLRDSAVLVYNSAGVVTDKYSYFGAGPLPLQQDAHYQYTYSSGNITILKIFDPTVSTTTPYGTLNFEYDSKQAALYLGNDAYLPGLDEGFSSKNNPLKYTVTSQGQGGSGVVNYSYQYNSDNRPTTSVTLSSTGQVAYNVKYTYQ
jgi:hypothetical protein